MSAFWSSWGGNHRGGSAAVGRCSWEGKADTRRRTRGEAKPQTRSREDGSGLVEELADGLGGARSMWGAEWRQGDLQLALSNLDVASDGEELTQQRSAFLLGTQIVRAQVGKQVALGLIGVHLDDVCQMLAFSGEFDHGSLAEVSDFHARRDVVTFIYELAHTL